MKKVLLLNPPANKTYIRDYFCSKTSKTNYTYEPTDLLLLSGILGDDFEITVIDAIGEKLSLKESVERVLTGNFDVVIFLTGSVSFKEDLEFIERVAYWSGSKILGIGDVLMENGEKLLKQFSFIDAIILDFTTRDVLDYLNGKEPKHNIIYRKGNEIINTGLFPIRGKEFSVPLPRHELFPLNKYRFPFARKHPIALIQGDYGCPFKCKFCIQNKVGFKWRKTEDIVNELIFVRDLGVKELYFNNATFGANKKETIKLLKEMIRLNFGFSWFCYSRVDVIDEELLKLMKVAGNHTIMFGIESGNQKILDKYCKGITIKQIRETFDLCKKYKIRQAATFMLGFPNESIESINGTVNFALELDCDFVAFNVPIPRMLTELRQEAIENKLIDSDFVEFNQTGTGTIMRTNNFSVEELKRIREKAMKRFYFRRKFLIKRLKGIRSLQELKQELNDGFCILKESLLGD